MIEESRKQLSECQSLVDSLWRESRCDDYFLVVMSEVKLLHDDLMEFYEVEWTEQTSLISRCIAGWNHTVAIYQKIYTMSTKLSLLKKSPVDEGASVPIEPCSALNTVDIDNIHIILYNDNESLMKYNPSELLSLSEEISIVEAYYEKECREMSVLLESFQFVQEPARMSTEQSEKRERFLRKLRDMSEMEECSAELRDGLLVVAKTLTAIEKEWYQVRVNIKPYVDNLLAKFTESTRLIDNLFRAYHLTLAKKRSTKIKSIF